MEDKKQLQTYLSLSTELYDLDKTSVSEDEFAFYMSYAKEAKGPILEPMCGSGRFLIPLSEAGFRVDGFDASPFMLSALYRKCDAKNLQPKIWQGFLQDLDLDERYGLVFIPDASFNLILNMEELRICLQKIYEHLEEDGRFVFELVTLKYAERIEVGTLSQFSKTRTDGKRIVQKVEVLPFEGKIARTRSDYELVDEEGRVLKVETEIFGLFLHNPDDVECWLTEVGFRDINRLKAFDRKQVAGDNDDVMVFECVK